MNLSKTNNGLIYYKEYKVYNIVSDQNSVCSFPSKVRPLEVEEPIEELLMERLLIIEDFIDSKVEPEKCENSFCISCIFSTTCSKSDINQSDLPF